MKFGDGLDRLLDSPTKLRLLRKLLSAPERRWTGRELAGAARVSTAQAARDLRDFLDIGIVLREIQGKSYSWHVNDRHVFVPELSRLLSFEANLRAGLVREVAELIAHTPVHRALLFGSVARGDERADSDVDLFLVVGTPADRPSVLTALEKVRRRIWDRYGNPVSSLVYTEEEARKPANPAMVANVMREGLSVIPTEGEVHGKD